jgi:hypothetical protein
LGVKAWVKNVLHVPKDFFCVGKSTQDGTTFEFNKNKCVIKKNGHSHTMTCLKGNTFFPIKTNILANNFFILTNQENNALLWHQKLGHV